MVVRAKISSNALMHSTTLEVIMKRLVRHCWSKRRLLIVLLSFCCGRFGAGSPAVGLV